MFRPSLGHLQALKEIRSKITWIFFIKMHREIVNAHKMCYKRTVEIVEYMCL
jgi:hypothetical protein